ncbi:MAG: hypothetical protein CVV37_03960 [Nitrospira bacterium HGW-Nitrospira-1]|nr:MAG: hypothetical protein CVV37_03960 [Nitrospira bacterium HGW-Nitrospira-1]
MIFKRRKYIINTGFQMRFVMPFLILSLLGSIIATIAFNFFVLKELEKVMWLSHINIKSTDELIRPVLIYVNLAAFLFVAILLVFTSIRMTRKASEPILRMTKDVGRVTDGDLATIIALRGKDEFQDVAHDINVIIKNLRERFKIINEQYMHISGDIVESPVGPGNYEKTLKELDGLRKEISNSVAGRNENE